VWAEALKLQNGSQQTLEAHFTAILSLLDCKLFSEFAPNWLGGKFLRFLQKNISINSNKQIYFSIVVKIFRIIIDSLQQPLPKKLWLEAEVQCRSIKRRIYYF